MPALVLEHIRKFYRSGLSFKRRPAVEDVSLEVERGSIYGLLGPNGAGKTTTLKVLLGLAFPDSGSGWLLGSPLGDRSAHASLGFLPEQSYFYGFLTAERALALYGGFFGMDGSALERRSAELLDLVGLRKGSHLTLDKYSKGMLQRFGIAQALINDPELVIMDEPSSGLDPVGQKEVRDILLRLKQEGKTIMLSSHQLSEVENICDSVSIISNGRTVGGGRLSELLSVEGVTRITLQGEDEELRRRLEPLSRSVTRSQGRLIAEVRSGDVYDALRIAGEAGAPLISAEPLHRSLEDLFLETVRGAG